MGSETAVAAGVIVGAVMGGAEGQAQRQALQEQKQYVKAQQRAAEIQYNRDRLTLSQQINATIARDRAMIAAGGGIAGTAQADELLSGAASEGGRALQRQYQDYDINKASYMAKRKNLEMTSNAVLTRSIYTGAIKGGMGAAGGIGGGGGGAVAPAGNSAGSSASMFA